MDKFEKIFKRTTIFSKNTTPEIKEDTKERFKEFLARNKEEVRFFDDGLEKTPEQIKMINIAIELINQELEELGINDKLELPIERIHFLPLSTFIKKNSDGKIVQVMGTSSQVKNEIKINGELDGPDLLNSLIHELIHMASYEKYYIDIKDNPSQDSNGDELLEVNIKNRLGYHFMGSDGKPQMERLIGLNEMITEKIDVDICKKHKHEIRKKINLSRKEIKNLVDNNYLKHRPREILDLIIEEIARVKEERIDDVWKRFEKGLFTGEMMHLRDIERVFGAGALEVLSVLNLSEIDDDEEQIRDNEHKVLIYFITKDKSRREKIFEEIFNPAELKK